MKPVLIFSFWTQDEVDQYVWTLYHWDIITKSNIEYDFLLLSRFDFNGDISALIDLCSKWGETTHVKLNGSRTGFPGGCNEVWIKGMRELQKLEPKFGYWMEYDVTPKQPDWLNVLNSKWHDNLLLCGHLVTEGWLSANGYPESNRWNWGEHINGAALYSPNILDNINFNIFNFLAGWDTQIYNQLKRDCTHGFNLYDFRMNPDRDNIGENDRLMIHGTKTIEQKEIVLKNDFS
jgi:hypothetical protein